LTGDSTLNLFIFSPCLVCLVENVIVDASVEVSGLYFIGMMSLKFSLVCIVSKAAEWTPKSVLSTFVLSLMESLSSSLTNGGRFVEFEDETLMDSVVYQIENKNY